MSTLGERLKIALKNRNMRQSVLAYRIGVDRSYITNYISGKSFRKTSFVKYSIKGNDFKNFFGIILKFFYPHPFPELPSFFITPGFDKSVNCGYIIVRTFPPSVFFFFQESR